MKILKIFLLILMIINLKSVKADDFYWVDGTGDWTDANHWSDRSGGNSIGSTPGSADNVFFDDKSFTAPGQSINVNTFVMCNNMDWSSVSNLPSIVDDGDSDHYISLSGSLILSANMNFNFEQAIYFRSSKIDNRIVSKGRSFKNDIYFTEKGTWTIVDDLEIISGGIVHSKGVLVVQANIRCESYTSLGLSARELTIASGTISLLSNSIIAMDINTDNFTINPGTSSIEFISPSSKLNISGNKKIILNKVIFNEESSSLKSTSSASPTINHLEFLSSGSVEGNFSIGDFILNGGFSYSLLENTRLTVTNNFIARGDCAHFVNITGANNVFIEAANVDINSIMVSNIVAEGTAVPFEAIDSFNKGNCDITTGWNIINTLPRTFKWTGNAAPDVKWSNSLNWNLNCVPTQIDDVIINSGAIVNVDIDAFCKNITISKGKTLTGNNSLSIHGNLNTVDGVWSLNAPVYFSSNTNAIVEIDMGGQEFNSDVYFTGTSTYSLQSSLLLSANDLILESGNILSNSNIIKASNFISKGDLVRSIDLTGSVFTLQANVWKVEGSNFSYNGGEILFISQNTIFENNHTGDINYAKITFAVLDVADLSELINYIPSTNIIIDDLILNSNSKLIGNHTYGNLRLNPGSSYELSKSSIHTITGSLDAVGSCSKFISIFAVDGQATISSDVDIDAQYCRIDNIIAAGTGLHDASGSIEIGGTNNTWNFVLPASQDLYWTGAQDSNWFNSNNWTPSCVPTRVDNVFFDSTNYAAVDMTVLIAGMGNKAECNNMSWQNAGNKIEFTGMLNLNIFGSLDLRGIQPSKFLFTGDVYFRSIKSEYIWMASCSFNKNVYFQGSKQSSGDWKAGEWDFQDKFTAKGALVLEQGVINTLGKTVDISVFNSSFNKVRALNLSNSSMLLNKFEISPDNFFLDAGTSTLTFSKNPTIIIANNDSPIHFNDVVFSQNEGVGLIRAYAPNVSFNNVFLNCNTNFLEKAIVINQDLTLAQGKTYRFESGLTQTYIIGNIIALGGCEGAIDISTTTAGIYTTIKSTNIINVEGVILKDIHVVGDFTADASIDLGNNDGWTINKAPIGKNIFWVEDTGSWDDKSHWSYTSGGAPGACIPTALDNVIFDSKSFSIPGQFVFTGSSDIRCKTMDWESALYNPTFKSQGDIYGIYIYGSLMFSENMSIDLSEHIDFYFRASEKSQVIKTASYQLPGRVYFDGYDAIADKIGEWTLMDNFSVSKQFYLINGFFKTDGHNLNALAIYSEQELGTTHKGLERVLDIANSTVTIQGDGVNALRIYAHDDVSRDQSFDMIATNSTVLVETKASIYIIGIRKEIFNFNIVEFKSDGTFDANRGVNITTQDLLMRGDGAILGNHTFVKLELTKGKTYTLESDKVITVDTFIAEGTCNFPISIVSSVQGYNANVKSETKNVNLNFVYLTDIHADISTGFTYTVNNALDNGNNDNWILKDRDPVDLYWVGNGSTDGWHDFNNWAKISGGVGEGCVPTKIDNVFFDENSFLVSKKANIDSYAFCNSITWKDNVDVSSVFNLNDTLEVFNNLKFASKMALNSIGVILFKGTGSNLTRNINFADKSFNGNIVFDSENDTFLLETGLLSTSDIIIYGGSVNTQDNTIGAAHIIVDGQIKKSELILGNSKIILYSSMPKSFELIGSNLSIVSDLSRIEFPNGGGIFYDSDAGDLKLHDLIFDDNGIINIKGAAQGKFNNVKFAEKSEIFGSTKFYSLELSIGYENTIESGKIVFIEREFIMEGVTCEKATLVSSRPGEQAYIQSTDAIIKVYHASFQDINAISYGTASFVINGNYDDRGGNFGWIDASPDDDDINAPSFKDPMPAHTEYCSDATEIDDILSFPISKNTIFQWYKYNGVSWDILAGETKAILGVKAEGKYRIILTYNPTCNLASEIEIKIDKSVEKLSLEINPVNISCFKSGDGSIRVLPSDGYPDYQYKWYDKDNNPFPTVSSDIIIDLEPGKYRVKVTDSKACSAEITADIFEAEEIIYGGVAQTDINCFGDATGQLIIDATGGDGTIQYSINGILQSEDTKSNLIAGDYIVYAQDDKKCKTPIEIISIVQPKQITFDWIGLGLNCNGDKDGTIDPKISGGIPSYTYSWTGPNSLNSSEVGLSKLDGGNYSLTITDANNCIAQEDYILHEPLKLIANITLSKAVKCNGDNQAQIFVEAQEGTSPYLYTVGANTNNHGIFSELVAGDYNVNIEDTNGCITNSDYTITQPKSIILTVNDNVSPSCPLLKDGFISISSFEGTGEFIYRWTGPNDFRADTEDINSLDAGNYDLLVIDSLDCKEILSVNLQAELKLQLGLRINNPVSNLNARDGSFSIEIIGGKPNYNFTVEGPSSFTFTSPADYFDNVFKMEGLSGGVYTVRLNDQSSCGSITQSILIPEPDRIFAKIIQTKLISCFSDNDAALEIEFSGADDYTVSWTSNNGFMSSDKKINSLQAGVYIASVSAKGQQVIDTYTIIEPIAFTALVENIVTPSCNDELSARMNLNINGGTPLYTVEWKGPNGFLSKAEKIINISSGSYTYTVSDSHDCKITGNATISQPDKLEIASMNITNVSAIGSKDGEIEWNINGGTTDYVFFLTGPNDYSYKNAANNTGSDIRQSLRQGIYTLEVLDKNECRLKEIIKVHEPERLIVYPTELKNLVCYNEPKGEINIEVVKDNSNISYAANCTYLWKGPDFFSSTDKDITGLYAGKYSLTLTDIATAEQVSVEFNITQPKKISIDYKLDNITCFGQVDGYINVFPEGGTVPYTYTWTGQNVIVSGEDQQNLLPGDYSVSVTDANQCLSDELKFTISDVTDVSVNYDMDEPSCFGFNDGEIDMTIVADKAPYSIKWDAYGSILFHLKNIAARDYTYTITDKNNCEHIGQVKLGQPTKLVLEIDDFEDSICFGDDLARAHVNATGGTPAYTYLWSNTQTTAEATRLNDGENKVIVTDSKLCVDSVYVEISNPEELYLQIAVRRPQTVSSNDGVINVKARGGVADYTIGWMQISGSDFKAENLGPKFYELYVEDANLCRRDTTIVLKELFEEKVIINKAFSPNGDGINDNWQIDRIQYVLNVKIKIYNRWGKVIYDFTGSGFDYNDDKWEGLDKGKLLGSGSYYYTIELDGEKPIIGSVTIVR